MKIQENLAHTLIDFFYNQYKDGYNTQDAKSFLSYMEYIAKDGFTASWSMGGTSVNCYGDKRSVSAEPEAELVRLDDFLMEHYPHIGFLQYKLISRAVNKNSRDEGDYYGGSVATGVKEISFTELQAAMLKGKVLAEDKSVDFYEAVVAKSQEYWPSKKNVEPLVLDEIKPVARKKTMKTPVKLGIVDQKKIKKPTQTIQSEKPVPGRKKKM